MTKNFPDSKCADDCRRIFAKCETEYRPPFGIRLTCSRTRSLQSPANENCGARLRTTIAIHAARFVTADK